MWRGLKTRYRDQVNELHSIHQALSAGGCAIDIGSNKGSYLYSMAKWSKGSPVIAFEPQLKLAKYLQTICKDFAHVRIENLAISDKSGYLNLFVPGNSDSPGASLEENLATHTQCHTEVVQITTLDEYIVKYIRETVKVIKIDVEGHELSVINGAINIILRDHPVLIIECEERHMPPGQSVRSFISTIEALGYNASLSLTKGVIISASQFDPAVHQKQDGERFWDKKDYFNNFIFHPR